MQINNLFLILSTAIAGSFVSAERDYEERAMRKLVSARSLWKKQFEGEGYSPLPPSPSYSQCLLALDRIVKQPQSCAQKYMSGAARSIYDPIYNWFGFETGILNLNIIQVAIQFSLNNGVSVEVYDAFNKQLANINESGIEIDLENEGLEFDKARTWPLNYPTFVRKEEEGYASITQNIWSVQGQLLTIVIAKRLELLPVVC